MNQFLHQSMTNRGLIRTLARGTAIISRYGIYRNKIVENLHTLSHILEKYSARATIPMTAKAMSRNPGILKHIDGDRLELAIHGYEHIDYTRLSDQEVVSHLKRSIEIFRANGFNPTGFRAPYLKVNGTILRTLKNAGLKYDSSYTACFDVIPGGIRNYPNVARLLDLYDPAYNSPAVRRIEGIVEIPVALPDDEILLDRLGYPPKKVAAYWIAALKRSMETDESVFVLQLHPERVGLLRDALIQVLDWAVSNDIRIRSLSDITREGTKNGNHYLAITGDIDIVRIPEIFGGI